MFIFYDNIYFALRWKFSFQGTLIMAKVFS